MPELPKTSYAKTLFRCFNTIKTSQNLLDDIGLNSEQQEVAKGFFYQNGSAEAPAKRVFERSAQVLADISAKFKPENWNHSRFSNGQWSVLYTAESRETALKEKMFHTCRFYKEESHQQAVNIDLAIAKLHIKTSHMIDLKDCPDFDQKQLRSPDMESYKYCQTVAKQCIDAGAKTIRSRSARDEKGYCVPVFDIKVIQKDYSIQKYIKAEIVQGQADLFYLR
ncbi:MAG: RES family NAD+ phosphorylase [Deltaproteobacteria bacterium]|nr:RES family NAD+ phosphorylase [Deltaproteobacteria bacterium]